MKAGTASRTAQYMALFRALETRRPPGKRLFTDPYAIKFLDDKLKRVTRISSLPVARKIIQRIIYKKIPGAFSSGLARTKYIDDLLKQSIDDGVKQLIILGAGFDTRALRLGFLQDLPVIEIDHPSTARLKMETLQLELNGLPEHVKYLQIDFNEQSLDQLAAANNINFSIPTAIIWEGVTNYLNADAIDSTFRFISKFPKGSAIIFTYVNQLVLDNPQLFFGAPRLLHDLEQIEERWTFGFRPEELDTYLRRFQLQLKEDLGATEYRARYIPERTEKGYEFYRVATAVRT
jgi:methyltransferase (TIGR00027 family)